MFRSPDSADVLHPAKERECADRSWVCAAIRKIESYGRRSADTHLIRLEVPAWKGVSIYFKDESTHPTGSLKHRLGRSLFLYGLCNGLIGPGTTVVEASSGSTAVSEAYFARLIGLPFVAVMPKTTSPEKIEQIRRLGGACRFVEQGAAVYDEARRIAGETGGHYMDQFTFAERATDWRGDNIASSLFAQMQAEEDPVPDWIVCGAGTGGTSATIGRYLRYRCLKTQLCLADPEGSVFHQHLRDPRVRSFDGPQSLIEGIGRLRLEPSFVPSLIDRCITVRDEESIAAARVLSRQVGRLCGGSTGTNFHAVAVLAREMVAQEKEGTIVSILCDSGERYRSTYFDDGWLAGHGIDIAAHEEKLLVEMKGSCF